MIEAAELPIKCRCACPESHEPGCQRFVMEHLYHQQSQYVLSAGFAFETLGLSVVPEPPRTLGPVLSDRALPLCLLQLCLRRSTTVMAEVIIIDFLPVWYHCLSKVQARTWTVLRACFDGTRLRREDRVSAGTYCA